MYVTHTHLYETIRATAQRNIVYKAKKSPKRGWRSGLNGQSHTHDFQPENQTLRPLQKNKINGLFPAEPSMFLRLNLTKHQQPLGFCA